MENSAWQKQTVAFDELRLKSKGQDRPISIVAWLRLIGIIPITTEWKRGNRHPNTNLSPSSIPVGYLAEIAHDWDMEGRTTPREFIDALAFEVAGTAEKRAVNEVQNELTLEATVWSGS